MVQTVETLKQIARGGGGESIMAWFLRNEFNKGVLGIS